METDRYQVTITRDEGSMLRLIDALELAAESVGFSRTRRAELEQLGAELCGATGLVRPEQPQDWIFTFGPDNLHPVTRKSLGRNFVKIHGTCEGTRLRMLAAFGRSWSSQYAYESGMAKIQQWGWTEIPLP